MAKSSVHSQVEHSVIQELSTTLEVVISKQELFPKDAFLTSIKIS